jgi:anti-anti-sigma factor
MSELPYQHLKATTEQGVLVLTPIHAHLRGDPLAEELRKEALDALAKAGTNKVVIDFRFVESFSTALFRPLLSLTRKLHDTQGRLVLCNLKPFVAEVFHATRMISSSGVAHAPFLDAPDLPAAIAKLNQAS